MSLERPQRSCHGQAIRIVGEHGAARRYFRQQMSRLYGLRVIADYNPEDVGIDRVQELVNDADKIRLYFLNLPGTNA
jgi:predicted RNase H-like nuclease (RuvC/YqgF family)